MTDEEVINQTLAAENVRPTSSSTIGIRDYYGRDVVSWAMLQRRVFQGVVWTSRKGTLINSVAEMAAWRFERRGEQ
jgi:hypothetical protein